MQPISNLSVCLFVFSKNKRKKRKKNYIDTITSKEHKSQGFTYPFVKWSNNTLSSNRVVLKINAVCLQNSTEKHVRKIILFIEIPA